MVHCSLSSFYRSQIAQVLLPWWHPSLRTTWPMPMCSPWCNSSAGRCRPTRWCLLRRKGLCTIWTSQSVTPWQWQKWLWKRPPKRQAQVQPPWHLHWRSVKLLHSWEFKRCWDLQSWMSIFLLVRYFFSSLVLCYCPRLKYVLNIWTPLKQYNLEMFVTWVHQPAAMQTNDGWC